MELNIEGRSVRGLDGAPLNNINMIFLLCDISPYNIIISVTAPTLVTERRCWLWNGSWSLLALSWLGLSAT